MLNYCKSEWYRIWHTSEIYVITICMAVLVFLMNLVLWIAGGRIEGFRYATVSFSLSNLITSMSLFMVAGAMVAGILFSGEKRYGILKNAIANGISREGIFCGKCIVSTLAALCSMAVIMASYLGSACLLLDGAPEPALGVCIRGVLAVLPCAIAALILAVFFFHFCEKEITAVIGWFLIMWAIPMVLYYAGFKIDILRRAAAWMPWNYLQYEVTVTMSELQCLWDTPQGLFKCLVSGLLGIVIFTGGSIMLLRKRE